jgi:hypothetical protein
MNTVEAGARFRDALSAVCRTHAIPRKITPHLRPEIRREHRRTWYTLAATMGRGRQTFSKDDPAKMCFSSRG